MAFGDSKSFEKGNAKSLKIRMIPYLNSKDWVAIADKELTSGKIEKFALLCRDYGRQTTGNKFLKGKKCNMVECKCTATSCKSDCNTTKNSDINFYDVDSLVFIGEERSLPHSDKTIINKVRSI